LLLRFEITAKRGPEVVLDIMFRKIRENFDFSPIIVNIEDELIVNHVAYLEIHANPCISR